MSGDNGHNTPTDELTQPRGEFSTPPLVHSTAPINPTDTHSAPETAGSVAGSVEKKPIGFSLLGNNPTGDKNHIQQFKAQCLSLAKMNVGVGGAENWNLVDQAVKDDIYEQLNKRFSFSAYSKNKVLSRVAEQLRTYRRNLRQKHFPKGASSSDILALKDKVPSNVEMPVSQWNDFLENEAKDSKMLQKEKNKQNRAKKTDVHRLGSKSYEDLKNEWSSKTKGSPDEGKIPTRANLYVHARRDKDNKFPPHLAKTLESIECMSSQSASSPFDDLDNDALAQTLGKDKRGRTRGLGSHMSKTKFKHTAPLVDELSSVNTRLSSNDERHSRTEGDVMGLRNELGGVNEKLAQIVSLLTGRMPLQPPMHPSFPFPPQNFPPSPFPSQMPVPPSSSTTHGDYGEKYYMKDLSGKNTVGVCTLISTKVGTLVHSRPLQEGECQIMVEKVYVGFEDVPVYVDSGEGNGLKNYVNSFIIWPLYRLMKI